MRLVTLWGSSGEGKTLEAILFGLIEAESSSPPNRLLEPPPGGRNTLRKENKTFIGSYKMQKIKRKYSDLKSDICFDLKCILSSFLNANIFKFYI